MIGLAVLAVVGAVVVNSLASLLESSGSMRAASGPLVWRQPRYLAGFALAVLGWVLSVVALRSLPAFVVQSVLASSIAVVAVAAHCWRLRWMPRSVRAGVVAVLVGLVLVAASSTPGLPRALPPQATPVLLAFAGTLALVFVPLVRVRRPLLTAVVAGVAFGGISLSVRAVHVTASQWSSGFDVVGEPLVYAMAVSGSLGAALVAEALRRGRVSSVTSTTSVTGVVVAAVLSPVLLGDAVRTGWAPALAGGIALTVVGVLLLDRMAVEVP